MEELAGIYKRIGDLFYSLNGRLEGLGKDNLQRRLMYWAWGNAYYLYEKSEGRL